MGSEWAAMILGVDTKKLLHFRRLKRLLKLVSIIEMITKTPVTNFTFFTGLLVYRCHRVVVTIEFPRQILRQLYLFWLYVKRGDMYVSPPVAFVPRAKNKNKYVQI